MKLCLKELMYYYKDASGIKLNCLLRIMAHSNG